MDLIGDINNNEYQIKLNNTIPLINNLEIQDIFKDENRREGDSVMDFIEEVLQLLITLTKLN